jgi:hypothetical protein
MRHLESRGLTLDKKFDWLTAASTNYVARWAVNTVSNMVEEMAVMLGKRDMFWMWRREAFPNI